MSAATDRLFGRPQREAFARHAVPATVRAGTHSHGRAAPQTMPTAKSRLGTPHTTQPSRLPRRSLL